MTSYKILLPIAIVFLLIAVTITQAQIPPQISYQAMVSDNTGNPIPDQNLDIQFRIYNDSTGGSAVWSESHFGVPSSAGFIGANIGGIEALDLDALGGINTFLEIVIGGETLLPRQRMNFAPFAGISQRVQGDIQTGLGTFRLMEASESVPAIVMTTDEATNTHSFKMIEPGDDGVMPSFEMTSDLNGSVFNINRFDTGTMTLHNPVKFEIDGLNLRTKFKMIEPGNDITPGLEMITDGISNSTNLRFLDPDNHNNSIMEFATGGDGGADIYLFNPQPEPPAKVIAISSLPSVKGTFKMFNPQPEPPADPFLEMQTTALGSNFAMGAPSAGPGDDIAAPMFEIDATSDGASLDLHDNIGKYMGVEPSPFMDGGEFYMMNPATDDTTISFGSHGRIFASESAIIGYNSIDASYYYIFGNSNTVYGSYGFTGGFGSHVSHNNCFVWADYSGDTAPALTTTANNQFLVRSTGGYKLYTNSLLNYGVALDQNSSSWYSIIPADLLDNSQNLNRSNLLNKIEQLAVKHVKTDNNSSFITSSPDEFNELFETGIDNNRISALDQSSVALAGVQALLEKIELLEARIVELETQQR